MADALISSIRATITWDFQDTLDLTTIKDVASLTYAKQLADGTGASQANSVWHDQRTVATGANDDLDLTALTNSIFGSTITINFTAVKALLLVNTNTATADELVIDSSVANAYKGFFNGSATSKVECGPDSAVLLSAKVGGFQSNGTVGGTNKVIRISNPAGGTNIVYKIAIIGTV